ncbi:MAG: 7TM-DISM domain-containing protein [Pseudomonadota bacterium]
MTSNRPASMHYAKVRRASSTLLLPLLIGAGLILLINWLLAAPLARQTHDDVIVSKGYYEDPGAQIDFNTAQGLTYTKFKGALSLGNSASAIWLKLEVDCQQQRPLAMLIQPAHVQDIQLYGKDAAGQWQLQQGGSRLDFSTRELPYLNFTAPIYLPESGRATFYARIHSTSAISLVRAVPLSSANEFNTLIHYIVGSYIGVAFMVFMISLMAYLVTRDTLWGWSAICELGAIAATVFQTGMLSRYILPDNGALASQLVIIGNCFFVFLFLLFLQRIMQLFRMPAYCMRPYRYSLYVLPVQLLLIGLGQSAPALALNNLLILVISAWGLLVAQRGSHEDKLLNLAFRVSLTGLTSYMIYWVYPLVMRQPVESFVSLYPAMPINMFSLIMLTLIMVRHTQLQIHDQYTLELQQRETELQLASSRARQAETEGFLGMIMHEVKSPLSFIRTAASNLELDLAHDPVMVRRAKAIKTSVDNIDNVLERSLDVDALERGAIQPLLQVQNVAAVVERFCLDHAHSERFKLTLPGSLTAPVDADILVLILRNLLDNAVKYSPAGSDILVNMAAHENEFSLQVSNVSSHGLPEPEQMFSKYYRSPRAMSVSGMGLGLYWVGTVTRMLKGSIRHANHNDSVVITLCLPNSR